MSSNKVNTEKRVNKKEKKNQGGATPFGTS